MSNSSESIRDALGATSKLLETMRRGTALPEVAEFSYWDVFAALEQGDQMLKAVIEAHDGITLGEMFFEVRRALASRVADQRAGVAVLTVADTATSAMRGVYNKRMPEILDRLRSRRNGAPS